ncbi:hypothetical protein CC1G_00768 [Coprinopsis cinerea okayama7|uniref:Mediator of RNA polymerase II transcription subunit 20 n=1 Tax=Coprinopsis cinerea (strain Okayama-7 / 130 / ATCC MYA-4618 / FGSC 9003) TaxID=240176 RepID=A8N8P3_COPC7|nr:hypothetical protein CC1G_00768 [Coprinopsis cinerea okayama7\|eukprot:XP_001831221.2 hypothetical protein CC1G_00768 [Coprinopsis cinerea okayama7\
MARWGNADAEAISKVEYSIRVNHNGYQVGRWAMSIKSYRSTFGMNPNNPDSAPSGPPMMERTMLTVTMGENVFVLLEDPGAPTRSEAVERGLTEPMTHYRSTFLTVRPPGALEQLLVQLKARWMPVRQAATTRNTSASATNALYTASELNIEGKVFQVGSDWLVRVGMVKNKETMRGMLLEVEYLPMPYMDPDAQAELHSNFLTSLLPIGRPGANIFALTANSANWQDVLWSREDDERKQEEAEAKAKKTESQMDVVDDDDDVYVYGVEVPDPIPNRDWIGMERDKRSAYLALGGLKSEGIV